MTDSDTIRKAVLDAVMQCRDLDRKFSAQGREACANSIADLVASRLSASTIVLRDDDRTALQAVRAEVAYQYERCAKLAGRWTNRSLDWSAQRDEYGRQLAALDRLLGDKQ